MALLLVLAVTSLLLILGVSMLSLSLSEKGSSKVQIDLMQVKQMHDTAVNLSLSQLRVGTQQDLSVSGREVWISQPGALRSFRENGELLRAVKLYSDDSMVVTSEAELVNDVPPADWNSESNKIHYGDLNAPVLRGDRAYFPIVDPAALEAGVEGFDFNESAIGGVVKTGDSKDLRLPMPVRWLYVLEDGTLGTLGADGAFNGPKTPTKSNRIVGRVAFWADDESSKINVNTASEPTPWDTPRAISESDLSYGIAQPARNEYQRYPGHPATTALSSVLTQENSPTVLEKEEIYGRVPRVVGGGTLSGTRKPGTVLIPDEDRLFATTDEFLFQPDRSLAGTAEQIDQMRQSRFFLTSNSRAPEVNPLGHPKVAIWPLGRDGLYLRTAFDQLIAFCSTVGDDLYAFQRHNPNSATNDWTEIPRNQEMLKYVIRELSETVPGYSGDFDQKWGDDLPQVATEIFDYIRCANLREKARTVAAGGGVGPLRHFAGNGQVVPIKPEGIGGGSDGVMGFGRFFTASEFGLHFICNRHDGEGVALPDGESELGENESLIQAAFLIEPFSPAQGWPKLINNFKIRVSGLDALKIGDESLEFPAEASRKPGNLGSSFHGRNWGGPMGVRTFIGNRGNNYEFNGGRIVVNGDTMSFKGGKVTVEIFVGNSTDSKDLVQTIELDFPDAEFPVPELVEKGTTGYRGASATDASRWWLFGPNGRYNSTTAAPQAPGIEYDDVTRQWPGTNGRTGFKSGSVFRSEDVIRTLTPVHSDNRLVAGVSRVDSSVFQPGPNYYDTDVMIDHMFNDTQGTHLLYGFSNEPGLTSEEDENVQLTPATYHYSRLPDVRPGTGTLNKFGDFDNGLAQVHDGAYINRPDEGNVATKGKYAYFAWNYSEPTEVNFSPNRQMPSPGMFGSLPTGIKSGQPWQTLLFRPQKDHPGTVSPPDHMLMEYFWMPVVEPYAISEPFSTAGKINMNYQILPFTYIKRSTGLNAVLKGEKPLAIDNEVSLAYKLWDHETSDHPRLPNVAAGNTDPVSRKQWDDLVRGNIKLRKRIDADITLQQFETKFDAGEVFKYPSEICDIHLVREGEDLAQYENESFQADHVVTGDNSRERPYTNLYPRLTTRSNTFRVYVIAETLNESRESDPATFDPALDSVSARFRGSTLVERYVSPNEKEVPDFAAASGATASETIDDFFQFRILESSRFAP